MKNGDVSGLAAFQDYGQEGGGIQSLLSRKRVIQKYLMS